MNFNCSFLAGYLLVFLIELLFIGLKILGQESFGPLMVRITEDLFRSSIFDYSAFIHKDDSVGNIAGKAHFMSYHHHGES